MKVLYMIGATLTVLGMLFLASLAIAGGVGAAKILYLMVFFH